MLIQVAVWMTCLAFVHLGLVEIASSETIRLRLKRSVEVRSPVVRLGNLVEGPLSEYLRDLKVLQSPRWGGRRVFTREAIHQRLMTLTPHRYIVHGSPTVEVIAAGGDRSDEVRERLTRRVVDTFRDSAARCEIQFPNKALFLPEGLMRLDVQLPDTEIGVALISCVVIIEGRRVRTLSVPCRITREAWLAVATRTIEQGDSLRATDYAWHLQTLRSRTRDCIGRNQKPHRYRAKRTIHRGEIMYSDLLEEHPLIRRGQLVDLVVERSIVRVTAKAKAIEDGWMGSRIRVKNLVTNRFAYGRVADKGVVFYE